MISKGHNLLCFFSVMAPMRHATAKIEANSAHKRFLEAPLAQRNALQKTQFAALLNAFIMTLPSTPIACFAVHYQLRSLAL